MNEVRLNKRGRVREKSRNAKDRIRSTVIHTEHIQRETNKENDSGKYTRIG